MDERWIGSKWDERSIPIALTSFCKPGVGAAGPREVGSGEELDVRALEGREKGQGDVLLPRSCNTDARSLKLLSLSGCSLASATFFPSSARRFNILRRSVPPLVLQHRRQVADARQRP